MIQLDVGNVYSYVKFSSGTAMNSQNMVIEYLRDNLKYPNDVYSAPMNEYIKMYTYLITPKGRFMTGLIGFVTGLLKSANLEYEILNNQDRVEPPDEDAIVRRLKRLSLRPRPYQVDAIFEGIQTQRGMFDMCTGAGKSLVMAGLLSVWDLKALIVVDSTDLASQLRADMAELTGQEIGLIGSGTWDPQRITVAMVQSLTRSSSTSKKGKKIREFLSTIQHLLFDEVHHAQSATWGEVSKMCKGAVVRHGMSGTCFSSEIMIEDGSMVSSRDSLLIAHTGPVLYHVTAKSLIEAGYLSKPNILVIQNKVYSDSVRLQQHKEYERIIMNDANRNKTAATLAREAYDKGGQTIVFVTRIEHGEIFEKMLVDEFSVPPEDVVFVSGRDDKLTRKETIADFKSGKLPILIGTVIGEGLNFYPTLGINLAGGQSKKDIIQRLGRVLRKPPAKGGDADTSVVSEVAFVDFSDAGHHWYERHGKRRLEVYTEQGHDVQAVHYLGGQLLASTTERLEIKGDNLKAIYSTFEAVHKTCVGPWTWDSGQKPRVKNLFVTLTEAINIRENARFDEALDAFAEYLTKGTKAWLRWPNASPVNYLGFLANQSSVDIFAAKKLIGPDTQIAGTEGDSYWEW